MSNNYTCAFNSSNNVIDYSLSRHGVIVMCNSNSNNNREPKSQCNSNSNYTDVISTIVIYGWMNGWMDGWMDR